MGTLRDKQIDSLQCIALVTGGSCAVTAFPTFAFEAPKQVVLGVADISMCVSIWKNFFKQDLSERSILDIMTRAGLVAVVAGGTGWVLAKGATGLLHEVGNLLGPVGMAISGGVAASATATLGIAWLIYCSKRYAQMHPEECDEKTSLSDLKRLWAEVKKLFRAIGGRTKRKPAGA